MILCVANLSRFAQPVELDLSEMAGMKPVEMLGYVEFPLIGRAPYVLSVNPYGFFWFELQGIPEVVQERPVAHEQVESLACAGWMELFESGVGETLESSILPHFLAGQRWFAGKGKNVESVRIHDWAEIGGAAVPTALILLRVRYSDGGYETYFTPVSVATAENVDRLVANAANRVLCRLQWNGGDGLLYDSTVDDDIWYALLSSIGSAGSIFARKGLIRAERTGALMNLLEAAGEKPVVQRTSGEQSNTSGFYSGVMMLKLYRKPGEGVNPELEVLRFLTSEAGFDRAPLLAGAIEYSPFEGEVHTLAVLESAVENQGTGWDWMLEELGRFYEQCAVGSELDWLVCGEGGTPVTLREAAGLSLEAAATLGRRTAELHIALSVSESNMAFAPELFTEADLASLANAVREEAAHTFKLLKENLSRLPDDLAADAARLLQKHDRLISSLEHLGPLGGYVSKIRVHGDYHLGQVLRVKGDYVIIDFEGEPGRSLSERRAKNSPLKDVAGMLRSFSYAAHAALLNYTSRRPDQTGRVASSARFWENETSSVFMSAYCERAEDAVFLPNDPADVKKLVDLFLLEKAFYELRYEINNRPAWIGLPLQAIDVLMEGAA